MNPSPPLRIALYQPDIPGNTGSILRLGACLGIPVHVIEPAGFDLSDRALRRAGMDYLEKATLVRDPSWQDFEAGRRARRNRLVAFTTAGDTPYTRYEFLPGDVLLFGRESSGLPEQVHGAADARLLIPMPGGGRSLNVALAAAMAAGEALRRISTPDAEVSRPSADAGS